MRKDYQNYEDKLELLEKELKKSQDEKQYMLGRKILKEILDLLRNNNHNSKYTEKISNYKLLLLEINKLSLDDFKNISVSTTISDEDMNNMFNHFLKEDDFNILMKKLGHFIIINNKEVIETKDKYSSVLLPFCSIDVYDDNGNLIKGGSDYDTYNYHHNYNLYLGIKDMNLSLIFQKLFGENKIDVYKMTKYFKDKIYIFPTFQSFYKFQTALNRYIDGDYVSSIHILVPTLEEVIMHISSLMQIDTIKLNRGKDISTNQKVFTSDFIESEAFKNKWTENFAILLDNVFLNELGYKIRHKVAHGDMNYFECDFRKNTLILTFFITISSIVKIEYH